MPKDNHPPYFPFFVDDFISDSAVDAMTNEEVGIYVRFLCKAWKEDPAGTIPDDDHILSNWAKTTPAAWKRCRKGVLRAFASIEGGRLLQKRMKVEWDKLAERLAERSESGKRGAAKRWQSDSYANGQALADQCGGNGKPIAVRVRGQGSGSESDIKNRTEDRTGETERPNGSENSDSERQKTGPPIDLAGIDWGAVEATADNLVRMVGMRPKPRERSNDRRQWLRYAVLAQTAFPLAWLMDAADRASRSDKPKQSKRAIFVKSLQGSSDMTPHDFDELARRIEIPDEVWNSPVLGGPK